MIKRWNNPFWPTRNPWMQVNWRNKFRPIVSEVSYFVGNPVSLSYFSSFLAILCSLPVQDFFAMFPPIWMLKKSKVVNVPGLMARKLFIDSLSSSPARCILLYTQSIWPKEILDLVHIYKQCTSAHLPHQHSLY